MSSARASRVLRGSVAAAFSTFVALLSHVTGGGSAPGAVGVAVPLALSVLVCVALAGRRLTLPRIVLSVAASQFLFHTLFVLGSSSGVSGSSPAGHAGHAGHAGAVGAVELSVTAGHPASHTTGAMWAAHIVAAAVTIAMLRQGDAALTRLAEIALFVAHAVVRVLALLAPATFPRPATATVDAVVRPLRERLAIGDVSRRGPPALPAS
jgi:hypothetical protein